jgi:hypothetical protein
MKRSVTLRLIKYVLIIIILVFAYKIFTYTTTPVVTPEASLKTVDAESEPAKEHFLILTLKERLSLVDNTFAGIDIRESNSSYTEDKKIIYLCLKNEHGEHYSMNTLVYVTLHEIAHLLNHKNYGHTPEFNKIFNSLLCKAMSMGVYDPSIPHNDWYCGVDIRGITTPICDTIEPFSVENLEFKNEEDLLELPVHD